MLHYSNVSDMVQGRKPDGGMVLQQPKVSLIMSEFLRGRSQELSCKTRKTDAWRRESSLIPPLGLQSHPWTNRTVAKVKLVRCKSLRGVQCILPSPSFLIFARSSRPSCSPQHSQTKTLRLEPTTANSTQYYGTASSIMDSSSSSSSASNISSTNISEATYVMWMGAGESNGTFGMSAVATSGYPDGPFSLRRTLYPDGNETHDQTVFIGE